MFGGGLEVKYWAMRREQRVRKVDWRVAIRIGGAMSLELVRKGKVPNTSCR